MSHPETTGHPDREDVQPDDSTKLGLVVDGRYRISELIGRGGMGTVFKAEHIGIGRTVAVKLLHPSLAQVPEIAKRFEREALAIGRIEHPNCVDVSDSGKIEDGSLFLVMEYLEGQSVGDLMADEGLIEPRRALHIMRHVLAGLGHAHEAHIVHRDIKPENIFLVDQDGDPAFAKILDFGIAKLVGSTEKDSVKLTQAGVAFGTPVYMSPEQAVGNPVDGRADLYASTVVLYEMLTGRPPFYSDDKIEVMSMHTTRPPPSFAQAAPGADIPIEVEELVMRGLAKKPTDRFADAAEYIAAIDEVLGLLGLEPAARARSRADRTSTAPVAFPAVTGRRGSTIYPEPVSRKPIVIGLAAILAVVAIALIVAFTAGESAESIADDHEPARQTEESVSITEQARNMLEAGDPESAIRLLESEKAQTDLDPGAQLQLAHAYALSQRPRDAVRAYERAITLDDSSKADPLLRVNLQALLIAKDQQLALDAADILVGKLDDEIAKVHLAEIASRCPNPEARLRARELAGKHEIINRVDRVASFSLDLEQGARCNDRKKAVFELRTLGDPRAIKALQNARIRRAKRGRNNINACLKEIADETIAELQAKAEVMEESAAKAEAAAAEAEATN